jgi:hypothetical protein
MLAGTRHRFRHQGQVLRDEPRPARSRGVLSATPEYWHALKVIRGTLIAESLRLNVALQRVPLAVSKITRVGPLEDLPAGQPSIWTFVEFTAEDARSSELADSLAEALDAELGWYCDFRSDDETFVVFSGRVFRYKRGDPEGRAQAAARAREVGLPESQIDWPE